MQTALEVVKAIDELGAQLPLRERKALWNIISAMRGPDKLDVDDYITMPPLVQLKWVTTARLRGVAFPKITDGLTHVNDGKKRPGWWNFSPNTPLATEEQAVELAGKHFTQHYMSGARALGVTAFSSGD